MAKCAVCNNKTFLLSNSTLNFDGGNLCKNCSIKIGIDSNKLSFKETNIASFYLTINDINQAIKNGTTINLIELKKNIKKNKQTEKIKKIKLKSEINNQTKLDLHELKSKKKNEKEHQLTNIKKQFEEAGVSDLFGTHKEVRSLPEILSDNERILYATSGFINGQTVLIVLTQNRILFINRGLIYGTQNKEIPLNKLNELSYNKGIMYGKITVINGATSVTIDNVDKKTAGTFAKKTRNAINNLNNKSLNSNSISIADELMKYKKLLDADAITQEEYDKKKKELLN